MKAPSREADTSPPPRERKAKITPLPLSQMVPMTIVVMNESICGTMLMPFIGPFVAYLQGIPVNEAGYFSGVLIGVFMLGQVVSAKTWGRISDKYGRRFPLISGLFTSGLMMLGFGLSTNVWMCAAFRFFHGLFNGNVLVAKTMMAEITDRTNQGGGFSFISLCSAFGFLIGPTLGGLLYDPPHSTGLAWVHFNEKGFFGRYPVFLNSLVVFLYTNVGMLVCTFLVKESNPHAQPLPGLVRFLYPCMWYRAAPFVKPPIEYEDEDEQQVPIEREETGKRDVAAGIESNSENRSSFYLVGNSSQDYVECGSGKRGDEGQELKVALSPPVAAAGAAVTCATLKTSGTTGVSPTHSLVDRMAENRYDFDVAQEMKVVPATQLKSLVQHSKLHINSPTRKLEEVVSDTDEDSDCYYVDERVVLVDVGRSAGDGDRGEWDGALSTRVDSKNDNRFPSHSTNDEDAAGGENGDDNEEVMTVFGYREAFARPSTRFMLTQYMVLSASDMIAGNCFPLWAVASASVGGLGLTTSQVSYILLANSAPCLMANVMFRIVERYFTNKMGLMRVGLAGAGMAVMFLPFNFYLGTSFMVYVLVFICTAGRQVFCSWCYSLNTMLTARTAPPGHVGTVMGINQSCGALVRGIVPFVAAPMFAWSISGNHIYPLNHALVFFVSSVMFLSVWLRSYGIRTDKDGNLLAV